MAFSSLLPYQMVSDTEAATGGFTLNSGQSHTYTGKLMTKSEVTTKYNLDTSYLTSYASNQLIPKIVWVNLGVYDWWISISNAAGSGSSLLVTIYVNGTQIIDVSLSDGQSYNDTYSIAAGSTISYEISGYCPSTAIYSDIWSYNYDTSATDVYNHYEGTTNVYGYSSFTTSAGSTDMTINLDPL